MQITTLYRTVLVVSFITAVMGLIAGEVLRDTLPTILQEYFNHLYSKEISEKKMLLFAILGIGLSILSIAVLIGLWRFKIWARRLFLILEIVSLVLTPIMGPYVMNPWEALLCTISVTLVGALITLMYLSPIKEKFQAKG